MCSLKAEIQHHRASSLWQWLQVSGQQSAQKTEEWQVIQLQISAWIPEKLSFIHSLIRAEEHTTAAEGRGHSLRLWGIGMLEDRGAGGIL